MYDENDPNNRQADQAEAAKARQPVQTSGRFAQGFGARARSRTGLGQQAQDAMRMFWEDPARTPPPLPPASTFGGGAAQGYEKPAPVDLTPPGYKMAFIVDEHGIRHDYLDRIGAPIDMSWVNDQYHGGNASWRTTPPPPPVAPAAAAPPVAPPAAPLGAPPPAPPPPPVAPPPVDVEVSGPLPSAPEARGGIPTVQPEADVRPPPTTTSPQYRVGTGNTFNVPTQPTITATWGENTTPLPTSIPPAGSPTQATGFPAPVTQPSGWTATPPPAPPPDPVPRRFTPPVQPSDVTLKTDIEPLPPADVDGFLAAIAKKKA